MDDATRRALAVSLSKANQFDPTYSKENRRWFIDKLIRGFDRLGQSDAEIEANTMTVRGLSKFAVGLNRDFDIGVILGTPKTATAVRKRRVEILYGLIATDPLLARQENGDLLTFIARRRFRSVFRMVEDVNVGDLFTYPSGNCPPPYYHVQVGAQAFWQAKADPKPNLAAPDTFLGGKVTLFKPQNPASPSDSADAIKAIWKLPDSTLSDCDMNNFECALAMSNVLLDSLLEAKDPVKFINEVKARGSEHLAIRHVNDFAQTSFVVDLSPKRVFTKTGVPAGDLQVGDHVYMRNHAVYAALDSDGVWRGEHAIVADLNSRDLKKGIKLSGHGFQLETLADMSSAFLKTLQTWMDRTYVLSKTFLRYLESNEQSIPSSRVTKVGGQQIPWHDGRQLVADHYSFDHKQVYRDYRVISFTTNRPAKEEEKSFVASHIPAGHSLLKSGATLPTIAIHWGDLAHVQKGFLAQPFLQRTKTPATGQSPFDPLLWEIAHFNFDESAVLHLPLFKEVKGKVRQARLGPKDMPKSPFARAKAILGGQFDPDDVMVTIPNADSSPTHKAFLTSAGAI